MKRAWINLAEAARGLREQWQRATLTATGIMVAVVAITLLIGVGRGVQTDIAGQIKSLGVNVVIVLPARVDPSAFSFNPNLGGQSYLTKENAASLKSISGVIDTSLLTFVGGGVRFGKKESYPVVIAAQQSWFSMHEVKLREGRLYATTDGNQPICVIGSIAADELFPDKKAIGKSVLVNGQSYEIIGVTEDKSAENSLFSMASFQNVLYIPWASFKQKNSNAQVDRIMVQTAPEADPKQLVPAIESTLGKQLDYQQYSVLTQEQLLGLIYRMMKILTYLVSGLTGIALFVGGVGIMTVMLMSVNERSKEIGVRKTTGATRKDLFFQFLFEAILLALAGGAVGLAISYTVSAILTQYTVIKPEISLGLVAFSIGVSTLIGTVFGLIPASHAARKDPVDALRSE